MLELFNNVTNSLENILKNDIPPAKVSILFKTLRIFNMLQLFPDVSVYI